MSFSKSATCERTFRRQLHGEDVTERDAGLRRGDGEPGSDGKDGDDESEEQPEHLDPDAYPTLIRDRQPISPGAGGSICRTQSDRGENKPILDVHSVLALLSEPLGFTIRSDGGQTSERFREMSIQRRPQDGIQPLQLSRAGLCNTMQNRSTRPQRQRRRPRTTEQWPRPTRRTRQCMQMTSETFVTIPMQCCQ
jgi:hypothetical protein